MEKGALIGVMSLAVSDLLFCSVTVSGTNLPAAKMIYHQRDFVYFYTLYANCLQNVLIKTSTWFIVILGVSRNFVVSNPITARKYLKCKHTVSAILCCTGFWVLLHIPLGYTWSVVEISCPQGTLYFLKSGPFANNSKLRLPFIYTWFIIGFFIPVCILAYCNTRLICSLQQSEKLRSHDSRRKVLRRTTSDPSQKDNIHRQRSVSDSSMKSATSSHSNSLNSTNQKRITYTLIAVVVLFFACNFPSEIIQFYAEINRPKYEGTFRFLINLVNLLQAINFSTNFVLYCLVNSYFRKTLKQWFYCICSKCLRKRREENTDSSLMDKWSVRSSRFSIKLSLVTRLSLPGNTSV